MIIDWILCKLFGHEWDYIHPSILNKRTCTDCGREEYKPSKHSEWKKIPKR